MALSDLESKNYDKVLNWKREADLSLENTPKIEETRVEVSEFGDLKVTQIRQYQKRLSDEKITQAIVEYQNGMTTYQLAEKYGCSRQTISTALKQHGVPVSKCKAAKKIVVEEVVAMYADLITTDKIAQKYGVSPQVITKCLRDNNVKMRTRWDY